MSLPQRGTWPCSSSRSSLAAPRGPSWLPKRGQGCSDTSRLRRAGATRTGLPARLEAAGTVLGNSSPPRGQILLVFFIDHSIGAAPRSWNITGSALVLQKRGTDLDRFANKKSKLSSAGHRQAGGSCQEGGRAGQPPKLPTRREPSLSASPLPIYIWLHVYLYVFIDTASPFTASFPKLFMVPGHAAPCTLTLYPATPAH